MKRLCALFLSVMILLPLSSSLAAAGKKQSSAKKAMAKDVSAQCKFTATVNGNECFLLKLKQLHRCWNGGTSGALTVTLPKGQKAQGIMLSFHTSIADVVAESLDGDKPQMIAQYDGKHYNDYIAFDRPASSFRIHAAEGSKAALRISRIHVMTQGKLPGWIQRWETMPEGQADLMLIVTHPDDDILWFGGLLPTYAGQKKKKVLVAYGHTGSLRIRRNELLDALWHCGVTHYPSIPKATKAANYVTYTTELMRRYKPYVVITQDVAGEYGHKEHVRLVDGVIKAVTSECLKGTVSPDTAQKYGIYQPQKLYVHLWKNNPSRFNWNLKLSGMGNKTGIQLAREAFKKHESQQNGRHSVVDSGRCDCSRFGLYFTTVGKDDTKKPDFLQHIQPQP